MIEVDSINASYRRLLNKLEKEGKFRLDHIIPINNGRYIIAKGKPENLLIVFKREFFLSFYKQLAEFGATGIGESLNRIDVVQAIQNDVKKIVFIYQNGAIYEITVSDFLAKSFDWENKEGKEVKSTSIHNLTRLGTLDEFVPYAVKIETFK